jgi:serine/threonine protein kinase
VLHQIGSGVQGPVFRTSDPDRDRLVAVKAFRRDLLPEEATELARALTGLVETGFAHPSAVGLIGAGLDHGVPFLAMEYDAGGTLDVAIRRLAPADPSVVLSIVGRLAGVIDAAWSAGLGHGALHPRDVFLAPGGDAVRVTGIGVARALESVGLAAAVRRPHAAPERLAGGAWDVRADVYSLAVLAHDLLASRRSSAGAASDDDGRKIGRGLTSAGRRVFATALAESPDGRFASAGAFAAALEEALADRLPLFAGMRTPEAVDQAPASPAAPLSTHEAPEERVPGIDVIPDDGAPPRLDTPHRDDPRLAPALFTAMSSSREAPAPRARYPWAAIAAVAVAGVALGLAGYRVVQFRAERSVAPVDVEGAAGSAASGDLTEVPVAPSPVVESPGAEPPALQRAPRSPDRPTPASASAGRLVVRSSPAGALVTVDGQFFGETPVTIPDLPMGPHLVLVAHPGHVPESQRVVLTAAEPARTLNVNLAAGVDGTLAASTGALTIESRPRGARVTVDGRWIGLTPLRLSELSLGRHSVRLELAGYRALTTEVTVAAGPAGRLAVTLEPRDGRAPRDGSR